MHEDESKLGQGELSAEQRQLVEETLHAILTSSYFSKSKRYPALLEFSVRHTLEGNHDRLKERTVGMEVFGRSSDYDPSTDSVVRIAAGEVRKRMALYYSEHPHSPVVIELPFGSYMAEFHFRPQPAGEPAETPPPAPAAALPVKGSPASRLRRPIAAATVAAALILLAFWGVKWLAPKSPVDRFWAPLLASHGPVTIVLGTPFGPTTPPWESASPASSMVNFIHKQPDSPIPDITVANLIDRFLAARGAKPEIRMADSVQLSDLRAAPAVLIGAGGDNSWHMRMISNMRFRFAEFEGGAVHGIVDTKNPANQSWRVDLRLPYDRVTAEYALITRQLDPNSGQWVIGVAGTTSIGTAEAQRILLDPAMIETIESKLPRGWDKKNLQVVLVFTLINGSAGGARTLASEVW
jgi:hypothetical protein